MKEYLINFTASPVSEVAKQMFIKADSKGQAKRKFYQTAKIEGFSEIEIHSIVER